MSTHTQFEEPFRITHKPNSFFSGPWQEAWCKPAFKLQVNSIHKEKAAVLPVEALFSSSNYLFVLKMSFQRYFILYSFSLFFFQVFVFKNVCVPSWLVIFAFCFLLPIICFAHTWKFLLPWLETTNSKQDTNSSITTRQKCIHLQMPVGNIVLSFD